MRIPSNLAPNSDIPFEESSNTMYEEVEEEVEEEDEIAELKKELPQPRKGFLGTSIATVPKTETELIMEEEEEEEDDHEEIKKEISKPIRGGFVAPNNNLDDLSI